MPCVSTTDTDTEAIDDFWTTGDDIKKATIINLLRVMGETRALNVDVPIVFNRDSELFQSYLEQRRTPRKVDYSVPDTLFREDIGDIKPPSKGERHHFTSTLKPETSTHLQGLFVQPHGGGGHVEDSYQGPTFEYFPAIDSYETPPKSTTSSPNREVNGYQVLEAKPTLTTYLASTTTVATVKPSFVSTTTTTRPTTTTTTSASYTTARPYVSTATYNQPYISTTSKPHTTQKTYMNLVNEQPYTTLKPYYPKTTTVRTTLPVTSSYGGRGSVTFLENTYTVPIKAAYANPAPPVKTFSAYQGHLQQPKKVEPSPTPQATKYYYKPLVEPVYKPQGSPADTAIKTYSPVPTPNTVVIKGVFHSAPSAAPALPAAPQPYAPPTRPPFPPPGSRNPQVEYTTPHPLIYGFKPVVATQVKYFRPPPPPPSITKHPTTAVLNQFSSKPADYLRGNFRQTYQAGSPPRKTPPPPRPSHHSKPVRFPPGRLFRAVF